MNKNTLKKILDEKVRLYLVLASWYIFVTHSPVHVSY